VSAALEWLEGLPRHPARSDPAWYRRLIEEPLGRFEAQAAGDGRFTELVAGTRALTALLREAELPLVTEHGDLGHPNVLLLAGGSLGVLDWELGEPAGLPVCDLYLFLAYVASSRNRATTRDAHLSAFRRAFVEPGAWARPVVAAHAWRIGIDESLLTPLFVACWARYAIRLCSRLDAGPSPRTGTTSGVGEMNRVDRMSPQMLEWLRHNRYQAYWAEALREAARLRWGSPAVDGAPR
jgi:hypothetical protein